MSTLERLALQDTDPRTRRACALPLASLCYGVKRSGGLAAAPASSGGGGSSASKGLQQLPADGVLRQLLESLLEGCWLLPGGSGRGFRVVRVNCILRLFLDQDGRFVKYVTVFRALA